MQEESPKHRLHATLHWHIQCTGLIGMHTCALLTLFIIHTRHGGLWLHLWGWVTGWLQFIRSDHLLFHLRCHLPFALTQFASFYDLGVGWWCRYHTHMHTDKTTRSPLTSLYMCIYIYIYICTHVHFLFEFHRFHRFSQRITKLITTVPHVCP